MCFNAGYYICSQSDKKQKIFYAQTATALLRAFRASGATFEAISAHKTVAKQTDSLRKELQSEQNI